MDQRNFTNIRSILLIGFQAGILYTAPSLADVQTITHGKSLVTSCQQALNILDSQPDSKNDANQNDAFLCMAYLSGVMATAQHANELARLRYSVATGGRGEQRDFKLYCFDWQIPYKKVAQIVLAFARNQPHYLQGSAHKLTIRALQTAFPCP